MSEEIEALVAEAEAVLGLCRARKLTLAAAESCTGGMISAVLTEVPGSSDVFERGFVTYSNAAKTEQLGVPSELIAEYGAVSKAVAKAMVLGTLDHSSADLAIAVTGIAGPGGGTAEKPVGLVHLAGAKRGATILHWEVQAGDIGRRAVRIAAVKEALGLIRALI
jgi:nicotinamide-nucleotide amidase